MAPGNAALDIAPLDSELEEADELAVLVLEEAALEAAFEVVVAAAEDDAPATAAEGAAAAGTADVISGVRQHAPRPPQHPDRPDPARAPVQPPRASTTHDTAHHPAPDALHGALRKPEAQLAVGAPGEQDQHDGWGEERWVVEWRVASFDGG